VIFVYKNNDIIDTSQWQQTVVFSSLKAESVLDNSKPPQTRYIPRCKICWRSGRTATSGNAQRTASYVKADDVAKMWCQRCRTFYQRHSVTLLYNRRQQQSQCWKYFKLLKKQGIICIRDVTIAGLPWCPVWCRLVTVPTDPLTKFTSPTDPFLPEWAKC